MLNVASDIKILVLWDGVHKRDLAQKDMYDLIGVQYTDSKTFFDKLRQFKPDIVWLDIYHQHIKINWNYVFRSVQVPVIIDQADNEDFAKKAMRYRFNRKTVATSRYLPNKPLKIYCDVQNIPAMQLSWYVNPERFKPDAKSIDVGFVCYPKGKRGRIAQELKEVCDKNGWSLATGHIYGQEYADIIRKCKVWVVECDRKCVTQKYIEGSLAGCTLAGDVPLYPANELKVYSFDLGIENMIRQALEKPVVNKIESNFLTDFANIVNYLR